MKVSLFSNVGVLTVFDFLPLRTIDTQPTWDLHFRFVSFFFIFFVVSLPYLHHLLILCTYAPFNNVCDVYDTGRCTCRAPNGIPIVGGVVMKRVVKLKIVWFTALAVSRNDLCLLGVGVINRERFSTWSSSC